MIADFILGIITYNRYDYLDDLLNTLQDQSILPKEIIISDNGIGYTLKKNINIPVTIIKNAYNYGTCRALNQIIKIASGQTIMFICDDIYFTSNDSLKSIYDKFNKNLKEDNIHLIWCNHWAAFIASPAWIEKTGYFDENIWPCYFEDSDMVERIRKKQNNNISHNCIGFKSVRMINNFEETEVLGNKRGTAEPLITTKFSDFKDRNLFYFLYKWKNTFNLNEDMHLNTKHFYVEQSDVDLFDFERQYLNNQISSVNIHNPQNNAVGFFDEIIDLKKYNIQNIIEYKTDRAYISRILLHLKPLQFTTIRDEPQLQHDILHHLNYLFNYKINIIFKDSKILDDINYENYDLLVLNNQQVPSNIKDIKYILYFSNNDNLIISNYKKTIIKKNVNNTYMIFFEKI
jgi:glycosyltransferase involved in cell wall biosynthesis